MTRTMKRLWSVALVVAACLVGAAMLRRPASEPVPPAPLCADPATCGVASPRPAPPAAAVPPAPPLAPPTREATPEAPASPSPAVDGTALREEADRLIASGKIVEGVDVLRKAVEAAPTAKNHGDLGSLLYRLTAFDEAAIHLRAAAERDPGNADRWIALANVYYRKVNPGEAWKAERRARAAEPTLELGRDAEGMRIRKRPVAPDAPP